MDEVAVEMDDGVRLEARVAHPTDLATGERAAGRFPVVIEHTPYPLLGRVNTYYAQYGYISVRVHARGTGNSGGAISPRDRV